MKTIYLKLTNRCNLHCKHCYNAYASSSSDMCDKVLDASLAYVKKIASENEVLLVFHGGEPLLAGYEFYEKALPLLNDATTHETEGFSLQSNLWLLDEDMDEVISPANEPEYLQRMWDRLLQNAPDGSIN